MNRRDFIYQSGLVMTASYFSEIASSTRKATKNEVRPDPNNFQKPVLKAIAYGVNAPNPHNTQAWKFQFLSDHKFLFFVDEHRLLLATDPPTRQIHIGCGCFLASMQLGMEQVGFTSQITYFPNGEYTQKDIGNHPIAKIMLSKNGKTPSTSSLITNAILERSTSRLKYKKTSIDESDFQQLLAQTDSQHSTIQLIHQPEKLDKILPILYQGMEIETFTHSTHEESRKWFRQNDDRIKKKRDGINLAGAGTAGIMKWLAEKQLKGLDKKTWHNKKANEIFLKKHRAKVMSTKGIVLFQTANNTFSNWIKVGQDYMRFSLACTQNGYFLHPLSQVLQEFEEMNTLRMQFEELMQVKAPKKIQMAVRIGQSKKPFKSYRRYVNSFA